MVVIHNESYSAQQFITNEEFKKGRLVPGVTVREFEGKDEIWSNLHAPSAAMWHLFTQTDLYRELISEA